MSDLILNVENVSKLYSLGTVGTGTFSGDVQRFWKTKILRQDDPFLKIGQTNDRTSKKKADFIWALQNINFEVKRGEVLGLIGKNGAGKSTLLKLLSRITSPTTGIIKSAGRMASLLEVGTGFHPELSGRENIFLNGAILGMTKKEIQSKFDEIVDFSGCELFIDTPTKRYSSGMTVRLGFAVAAFLDPEILIVDEVLAVGDAEFQKKAIGKMKEVSSGGGRTVLFVSHNLGSIQSLCTRGILLDNGGVVFDGKVSTAISRYLDLDESNNDLKSNFTKQNKCDLEAEIIYGSIEDINGSQKTIFDMFEEKYINMHFRMNKKLKGVTPIIQLVKDDEIILNSFLTDGYPSFLDEFQEGQYKYKLKIPFPLKEGRYSIHMRIGRLKVADIDLVEKALIFDIENTQLNSFNLSFSRDRSGIFPVIQKWEIC